MKVSDYIATILAKEVRHVFVGTGGCIVHLIDSMFHHPDLNLVSCANEQGAAIAAEAYARVTKNLGIAVSTSGPGMVNLIQGIASAYYDSIPCLFITGQVPRAHLKRNNVRQFGFQEMEVLSIVKSITKHAVLISDPNMIEYELNKLIYMAVSGRPGPVLLDLPDDIQRADVDIKALPAFLKPLPYTGIITGRDHPPPFSEAAMKLRTWLEQAERPVIVAGGGVKIARCEQAVKDLLKKTGVPFLTTWATIDVFTEDTPNLVGNFGITATRYGNLAIQNSDLIVGLGCRFDTHMTGDVKQFAPHAKKVLIDIDRSELDKHEAIKVDMKIQADLAVFIDVLTRMDIYLKDLSEWKSQIAQWRHTYPICEPTYYEERGININPYVFMDELSVQLPKDSIIITDAGATLTWTMQGFKIRKPQRLFSAFNHSPMGYSLPAAIGAQLAAPEATVVCIIGDGGLQMNIQELQTVVFRGLPIKIFVMNNEGYGMIKQTQDTWLDSRYAASSPEGGLGNPDFIKVADAFGLKTFKIDKKHQSWTYRSLAKQLRDVLDTQGPVLCDVKIDKNAKTIPKVNFGEPLA